MRLILSLVLSWALVCNLSAQQILPAMGSVQGGGGGGGGGPAVVQSGTCAGTTTCNITFGASVAAGDYILAYEGGNGNSTGVAVTMTGETFTRLSGTSGCSNGTGFEGDCFLDSNAAGGQTVLTCTASTGSNMSCEATEITSPSAGHTKDAGGNAHATTTTVSVATSAATTNAGDICIGMAYTNTTPSYTVGGGWTSVVNVNVANGTLLFESQLPGTTGVVTATATAPSGATNVPEGIVCLKP